ncbi:hypothetical protein [Lysinibacillus sp. NPDC056232]|uniref:hypothetical protein n=1 Tax=Lysinibacillus sp. NPDC056232 TaxID=3345756 RepID=UPI0035D896EF
MSRLGQHDVGHEGVITGCDALSLRSSIADPQGVAQLERRSTYIHGIRFTFHPLTQYCHQLYKSSSS